MRQRLRVCKRWLAFVMSLAMVLTTINVQLLTAKAAAGNDFEATSGTHGATYNAETKEVTFWVKNTDAFYDQISFMWYKEYATYEEAAQNHVSAGGNFIAGVGATGFTENGDKTEKTVTVKVSDGVKAILYYINGEAGHDRFAYEHIVLTGSADTEEPAPEQSPEPGSGEATDPEQPAVNAFEATSGTHGATYNAQAKEVTFWVKNTDKCYDQISFMWYKEYATYEEAAQNHISAGGNFIAGVGATGFTENGDKTEKTVTVKVSDGVKAILYYINGEAGHDRNEYEHVVLTDGTSAGGSTTEPSTPPTEDDETSYINFEELDHSADFIDGGTNVVVAYSGTTITATGSDWGNDWAGDSKWQVQLKELIPVTAGQVYDFSFKIKSDATRTVFIKLGDLNNDGTVYYEGTVNLTAGVETVVSGKTAQAVDIENLMVLFALGLPDWEPAWTVQHTVTISDLEIYVSEDGSNDDPVEPSAPVEGAIDFDNVTWETYRSQDDGGWAGDSNVVFNISGTSAVITADNFGWNPWGIQWKLLGLTSAEENNVFEFDVVSTVTKNIAVKDENSQELYTINLVANEPKHCAYNVAGTTFNATFDLSGGAVGGSLTFTNVKFAPGTVEEEKDDPVEPSAPVEGAIDFDNVTWETYRSQDDGGWAGDSNVIFNISGTSAVITADNFGWNPWGIQWKLLGLTSAEENNVFEFDVVSTVTKDIVFKDENSQTEYRQTLTANEKQHLAFNITGTTFNATFDLSGGAVGGSLTFTNVKFAPGTVEEGGNDDPVVPPTIVEGVINFDNVTWTTYRSQDDGGWAGDSNVVFNISGTTAVISADSFGWNPWGIQWAIKNLASDSDENIFAFDVVSTITKDIVFKDENSVTEHKISLVAGQSQHLEYEISGSPFSATFDLSGGTERGSVTFTNMTFGPSAGSALEAGPVLTSSRKLDKANGFKVGEDVVLNLSYDGTEWAEQITALKINNKTIDGNYSVAGDKLTLNGALFAKQGVYKVEIEADGYKKSTITLPVYDADVANEKWNVEWEDQFNGTALDETKWSYEIGIQSGEDYNSNSPVYWGNDEKQYYTKEAVEVKDGHLVITGNRLTDDVRRQYGVTDGFVQYTSGRIRTITDDGDVLAATTYGRIEAMMELPASKGYWPAFWMLPTPETTDLYGIWATSGELDIMEAVGQNPTQVNGTIHYGGPWPRNQYSGGTYVFPEGESIAQEHLYAVEWEPGEIRWYVDDVLYHVENNWYAENANGEKYSYPAPFDESFYILFNLAMSGNYVANVDPDVMGLQMKVDYVRILTDGNTDYDKEVTTPNTDKDSEFLAQNGGYDDLIKDKAYTTLPNNAYGDGGSLLPGNDKWWSAINTGAGAAATVEVVGDAAKFNVTKTGSNDYNVQLIQNIPLAKGYTYRVTFEAWTDVTGGRTIRVAPGGDMNHGWSSYASGISPSLTSTRKTYQFDFLMAHDSDPSARLEFNLGGATGTVYIANVTVKALTDEELAESNESGPKEPLANGEHIYNGTFDKGTGKLGYWSTEGTKGSANDRNYKVTVAQLPSKLIQEGIQLLQNDTYKLTFDAQAANAGKVKVTLLDGDTTYATKTYTLQAVAETYEMEFTVPDGKGTDACRLEIEFLNNGETYVIDNVSMKRLTNVNIEWSNYELYPIKDLTGFTTYDEVWNWTVLPKEPTDIGNGEMALAVNTTHADANWKVMLQREDVVLATGMTYHIRYAIKASIADQNVEVKIEDANYSPTYDDNLTIGTEWTYVDTTFTSTLAGNGALKFCLADVSEACTVYVKDVSIVMDGIPVPGFAEGSEVSELEVGKSVQLQIQHLPMVQAKYESFTFRSSNADVLEVSADGTLTAKSEGEAVITVISNTMGTEFSFTVKVVPESDDSEDPGDSEDPSDPEDPQDPEEPKDPSDPNEGGNTPGEGENKPSTGGNNSNAGGSNTNTSGNNAGTTNAGNTNAANNNASEGTTAVDENTVTAANTAPAAAPAAPVANPDEEVATPAEENEETVAIEDETTSLAAAPDEDGDSETITDADEDGDQVVIEDEEAPLASGTSHIWMWCALLLLLVAAAVTAGVFYQQKKRNAGAQKKA